LGYDRYELLEYTNALSDFRKACGLDPTNDYTHFGIWLCSSLLGNSNGANNELKEYLATRPAADSGDWPSRVGDFLTGRITEKEFLSASDSPDSRKSLDQHCEAYFYIGSKRLIAGDKAEAIADFKKCVETGVTNFTEYQCAKAELKNLRGETE